MSTVGIIVISAASGIGVAAFIYGLIRKASRVSWTGWQVLVLFALTFLLDVIPMPAGRASFWITAGAFLGLLGLDLLLGGLIRAQVMKCEHPNKHMVRLSRVSGGVCALMNAALLFGVLISLALAVCFVLPSYPAFLSPVFASSVWRNFLSRHVYDLFIITVCFLFVRMGLRVGFVRALYYLLMLALTFVSFFGAILLATKVGVFAGWGAWLARKMTFVGPAAASVLGHGVFALLFFAVLFAAVLLLGWLLHKGLRRALDCRTFGMISSILLFLIFLAVFFAVMCGLYYGVYYLISREIQPTVTLAAKYAARLFTSSPLSAAFYLYNPFLLFLG